MIVERIVDSGLVPEPLLRAGIRAVCALRLREQRDANPAALIAQLRASEVAVETVAANRQHYEVPAAFYDRVLGPHLKYSSCYWPSGTRTLGDAEVAMLELTAQRAGLADGHDFTMGGRVIGGDHAVVSLADDLAVLDHHRAKGTTGPGFHAHPGELDGAAHEAEVVGHARFLADRGPQAKRTQ